MTSIPPFPEYPSGFLGFYPIVPDLTWVEKLVAWGAKTIQLRIKQEARHETPGISENHDFSLEQQIADACSLCRKHRVSLIINDHWSYALKYKAFGIHLGQEDLDGLDDEALRTLRRSGLILGVSTHNEQELTRALDLKPSYIALGPIFPTTCKSLAFGPHGLEKIKTWRSRTSLPIVAIGGMKVEHVREALALGASGVAVISDVLKSLSPHKRTQEWLAAFSAGI